MKNKKGFTLIELLATIVILAVIALISVPIINKVMLEVNKSSFKSETQSILRALALEREDNPNISMTNVDKYKIENNAISYENEILNLDISMTSNLTGTGHIVYNENGDSNVEYTNGKFCAYKSFEDQTLNVSEGDCSEIDSLICFAPVIKVVPSNTKFSQAKMVEIIFDNSNNCINSYIINNENTEKQYTNKFEVLENTKITAITKNKDANYGEEKTIVNINTIDRTAPDSVTFSTRNVTTKSIEVIASAEDKQSGISMYAFSKDGGKTYSAWQKSKIYRFNDLVTNDYKIVVKAYNGTYGSDGATEKYGVKTSDETSVGLKQCPIPTYTIVPQTGLWHPYKIVVINYGEEPGCIGGYSQDGGDNWVNGPSVLIKENNTTIIARNTDGINTVTASSVTLTGIDSTTPELSFTTSKTTKSITITATASDLESGIFGYSFSKDGGKSWTQYQSSNKYTFDNLKTGTYEIMVKAYNGTYGSPIADESLGATISPTKSITLDACPVPTYKSNPSGWTQQKTVTIDYGNMVGCAGSYSIDGGSTWKTGATLQVTTNGQDIIAKNTDNINTSYGSTFKVTNIDRTIPDSLTFTTSKTTKSITVTASASDAQSGIKMYAFSKDGGKTYSAWQTSNIYTFNDLLTGSYIITVKAYNGTYNTEGALEKYGVKEYIPINEATSELESIKLSSCPTPTYSISPAANTWTQQKIVTINYGSMAGCTGSYSTDGGSTWKTGTSVTITTNGGTVIAKNTDGINTVTASTYTVINIDRTVPSVTFSTSKTVKTIKVTASASDAQSGIARYSFSKDGGSTWSSWQTSNVYTFSNLTAKSSYNIRVKAYNGTYGTASASDSLGVGLSSTSAVTTNACPTPTFSVSPSGDVWATSKTVTITYPASSECTIKKYSTNGGSSWTTLTASTTQSTQAVTFTGNGTLTAFQGMTTSVGTTTSQAVTKIDTTNPTVSISAVKSLSGTTVASGGSSNEALKFILTATASGGSGTTIRYCVDTTNTCTPNTTIASGTAFTRNETGTYYVRYNITSGAGKASGVGSYTAYVSTIPTLSMNISYNGSTVSAGGTVSGSPTLNMTCDTNGSAVSKFTIEVIGGPYSSNLATLTTTPSSPYNYTFDNMEWSYTIDPSSYISSGTLQLVVSCTDADGLTSDTVSQSIYYSPSSSSSSGSSSSGSSCTVGSYCGSNSYGSCYYSSSCYCSCPSAPSGGSGGTTDTDDDSGSSSGTTCKETCTTNASCAATCTGMDSSQVGGGSTTISDCVASCPKTCTTTCS